MTQRNNPPQHASNPGHRPVAALREARDMRLADVLIKTVPLSALILVLVLITGLASAEYGFV